jgi:hypothetical protein
LTVDDPTVVRLVRLVVATDWDAGFQLGPRTEPLPDVPPGGEYVVECAPQRSVVIREAIVHDFQLVQVATARQTVRVTRTTTTGGPTLSESRGASPVRAYHLDAPVAVPAGDIVAILLRNDSAASRKQKVPVLVRQDAASARNDPAPTGRAEDSVACPACGKVPGDSCDGPASHPSRLALYRTRRT